MELAKLSEIFNVRYGNSLELNRLEICTSEENGINFVSRTAKNNGVSAIVKQYEKNTPFNAGLITVAVGGSVLETFLQPKPFYTGYHVMVLEPKKKMTDIQKLYYCTCIRQNKYRYNYGRQANRTLKDIEIPKKIPKWVNSIVEPSYSDILTPISTKAVKLTTTNWKFFRYDQIFEIKKGKRILNNEMIQGETPCIRPIETNNGVYDYIDLKPNHAGNTITVNYNGSVAEAFYQPLPYFALDDVNILYPKFKLNPYIAMFLITLIRKEKYRFNYGRKWHLGRMNESEIKLPVNSIGKPDYKFMENYVKSLPFSKQLVDEI